MTTAIRPSGETPLSDDTSDEGALIQAAVAGDAHAFGVLLRRHDDHMRGVAWRLLESRSVMDDVLQDAYLKAWRAIGSFRGDAAFSSWLYTIVYRAAMDHHRGNRATTALPAVDMHAATGPLTPDRVADHASGVTESIALREALADLPADQLAVVALIDGEGHAYEEVADMLDISAGTVASRLHRGRAALRAKLSNGGAVR